LVAGCGSYSCSVIIFPFCIYNTKCFRYVKTFFAECLSLCLYSKKPDERENMVRNRASAKKAGTSFETLVAEYLAMKLCDIRIERRAKTGAKDRGDIAGVLTVAGGHVASECKKF